MNKLDRAKIVIKDLYEKYKDEGILTMYIWGSILTEDFNPETSDIDTIAIVKNDFPLELELKMTEYARNKYPDLNEFTTRVIYTSELDGLETKAPLAKVIYPPLLLLEMPNWLYVVGEKFTNQDFKIKPPTYTEAIAIRLSRIQKEGWDNVASIPEDLHMYFIKGEARLIDLCQKNRGTEDVPFSYSKILKESLNSGNDLEKNVVKAIFESRESNWHYQVFLKNERVFQRFLDSLNSRETESDPHAST